MSGNYDHSVKALNLCNYMYILHVFVDYKEQLQIITSSFGESHSINVSFKFIIRFRNINLQPVAILKVFYTHN